jgi:protein SCO1/2
MKFLYGAALLALLGGVSPTVRGAGTPDVWPAPSFSFLDQNGRAFTRKNLIGKTWVADFIYTQCTSICPMLTAQMQMVQREVKGHDVWFVSFSVDPKNDRPAALKAYAARWHDNGARWKLLDTRNEESLRALVTGMRTELIFSKDQAGDIMHSEWFSLIDAQGRVRGKYDSTNPAEIKRLAADAAALADTVRPAKASAGEPPAQGGRELAASMGCLSCHTQPRIAPPLEGVAGSQVKLDNDQVVMADEAYLRESIMDPGRKLVAGYGDNMPSYRDHLTDAQLDSLIAYLQSIGKGKATPLTNEPRSKAVDPVCGMTVSAAEDTPHAVYGGKTYYFCSDADRDTFERSPARFVH